MNYNMYTGNESKASAAASCFNFYFSSNEDAAAVSHANVVSPYFVQQANQFSLYSNPLIQFGNGVYINQNELGTMQNFYQKPQNVSYVPPHQPSSSSSYFCYEEEPAQEKSVQNYKLKSSSGSSSSEKSCKKPRQKSPKEKSSCKKSNRFDGIPEEEVAKKLLPDHIDHNLDILIIGINPGLYAAHKGHHYAGPGNHFWKCLHMSGITSEQFTANDDFRMIEKGIGFTNIVARTTRGSNELSKKEIEEGAKVLLSKLQYYKPKIAVFNGKGIYEIFSKRKDVLFGKQPGSIEGTNTYVWVMPSSSARCSQLPRAVDKLPYYVALKKFRDYLNGLDVEVHEEDLVFSKLKTCPKIKFEEPQDQLYFQEIQEDLKPVQFV